MKKVDVPPGYGQPESAGQDARPGHDRVNISNGVPEIIRKGPETRLHNGVNNLTFPKEKVFELTKIRGRPINMRFFKDGSFETTLSPRGKDKPHPEDVGHLLVVKHFSKLEQLEVAGLSKAIDGLRRIAEGKIPADLNDPYQLGPSFEEVLGHLGVDTGEPFTLNHQTFMLEDGVPVPYYPSRAA